jgi:hypothetical protein
MIPPLARRLSAPFVALTLIAICYGMARFPSLPPGEGDKLAVYERLK